MRSNMSKKKPQPEPETTPIDELIRKPTLGLCLMVPEVTHEIGNKLDKLLAEGEIEKVFLQVNGKNRKLKYSNPKAEVFDYEWHNDFAAARNALLDQVDTDYWMWMDDDDVIVTPSEGTIRRTLDVMEDRSIDVVYCPYHYDIDPETGEVLSLQYRERILKTKPGASPDCTWRWVGRIHETIIPSEGFIPRADNSDNIVWKHERSYEEMMASGERNHVILLEECQKSPRDPRDVQYLAISFFNRQEFDKAIPLFVEHIKTTGTPAHAYFSWRKIGDAHGIMGEYEQAIKAELAAIQLMPHYPDAYLALAQHYYETGDYDKCLEWLNVGTRKKRPKDLSVYDPTTLTYRPLMLGAFAHFKKGEVKEAYELALAVQKMAPNYKVLQDFMPAITRSYFESRAVENVKWLASYCDEHGGNIPSLLDALPKELLSHEHLMATRIRYEKPRTWDSQSVVIFAGRGLGEIWGSDTLDQGMGGSEEAVVYLSRELGNQGFDVTIYNERETLYQENHRITYQPWTMYNPNDEYNVFVAWRAPELAEHVSARLKLCDMHDIIEPERVYAAAKYIDRFMVKSQYHRDLYPKLPDEKFAIIGNGIEKKQFHPNANIASGRYSVGYFSSYDRGLHLLLKLWPKIRERVPEATLNIAYGWDSYIAVRGRDEYYHQMQGLLNALQDEGVTEYGRLSHADLAIKMLETRVWAYPPSLRRSFVSPPSKPKRLGCGQ
jgi:tetratricopeptide (TPR) repeat protein